MGERELEDSSSVPAKSGDAARSPWQLVLGLVLGIAIVSNPFGAYYWGYSFVPPLLLGFILYLFSKTRTVALGVFAAGLGLVVFVGTALVFMMAIVLFR